MSDQIYSMCEKCGESGELIHRFHEPLCLPCQVERLREENETLRDLLGEMPDCPEDHNCKCPRCRLKGGE